MMRTATTLLFAIALGTFLGCGSSVIESSSTPGGTDQSAAPEQDTLPEFLPGAPRFTIPHIVTSERSVVVPVTVQQFDEIAVCELKLLYDPEVMRATAVKLGPGVGSTFFAGLVNTPGVIKTSWIFYQPPAGKTLEDGATYMNITFEKVTKGVSSIRWDNSTPVTLTVGDILGVELTDEPYEHFYIDGSVEFE